MEAQEPRSNKAGRAYLLFEKLITSQISATNASEFAQSSIATAAAAAAVIAEMQ